MAKFLLLLAALATCAVGDCEIDYKKFLAEFPQKYRSNERKSIFCATVALIKETNHANRGFTLAVNEFSDWTKGELEAMLGDAPNSSDPVVPASTFTPQPNNVYPSFVDWRNRMPEVKDQGHCGSCWAFAAIAVVDFGAGSSHSEQQLVDCAYPYPNCNGGGSHTQALSYLSDHGSDAESMYPYVGKDESCYQSSRWPAARVWNVQTIYGEGNLAAAVSQGVVAVAINAGSFGRFFSYKYGVYDSDCGGGDSGHAVAVVGYAVDYWIIRNSWGPGWGMHGHMYFKRGRNLCAIGTRRLAMASAKDYRSSFEGVDRAESNEASPFVTV